MGWLDSITDSRDMNLSRFQDSEGQGNLVCCSPWARGVGHDSELNNHHHPFLTQKNAPIYKHAILNKILGGGCLVPLEYNLMILG